MYFNVLANYLNYYSITYLTMYLLFQKVGTNFEFQLESLLKYSEIEITIIILLQGHKGVTCFIVEREQEGFTVAKKEDKLGMRASGTCVLHFDNVKV